MRDKKIKFKKPVIINIFLTKLCPSNFALNEKIKSFKYRYSGVFLNKHLIKNLRHLGRFEAKNGIEQYGSNSQAQK